jgi:hypothetical protein
MESAAHLASWVQFVSSRVLVARFAEALVRHFGIVVAELIFAVGSLALTASAKRL